jgi:hypothetical protein
MKASLAIEAIGDNIDQLSRDSAEFWARAIRRPGGWELFGTRQSYWVAEIVGPSERYELERHFLRGKRDYSRANSVGSRGVWIYYLLESGRVYEVQRRVTWGTSERFFCRVNTDGAIERITRKEVYQWLSHHGKSPSESTS